MTFIFSHTDSVTLVLQRSGVNSWKRTRLNDYNRATLVPVSRDILKENAPIKSREPRSIYLRSCNQRMVSGIIARSCFCLAPNITYRDIPFHNNDQIRSIPTFDYNILYMAVWFWDEIGKPTSFCL